MDTPSELVAAKEIACRFLAALFDDAEQPTITVEVNVAEIRPIEGNGPVRRIVEASDEGHLEGSTHMFVGDVGSLIEEIPRDRELWTVCASGHRAAMAASLLDRTGVPVRLVTPGGVSDVLARVGSARGARIGPGGGS